MLCKWLILY